MKRPIREVIARVLLMHEEIAREAMPKLLGPLESAGLSYEAANEGIATRVAQIVEDDKTIVGRVILSSEKTLFIGVVASVSRLIKEMHNTQTPLQFKIDTLANLHRVEKDIEQLYNASGAGLISLLMAAEFDLDKFRGILAAPIAGLTEARVRVYVMDNGPYTKEDLEMLEGYIDYHEIREDITILLTHAEQEAKKHMAESQDVVDKAKAEVTKRMRQSMLDLLKKMGNGGQDNDSQLGE